MIGALRYVLSGGAPLAVETLREAEAEAAFGVPVREAYGLSQRALAQTLGLSAPMLSQLASGQRIKIGSPAVYARLVMLEERAQRRVRDALELEILERLG